MYRRRTPEELLDSIAKLQRGRLKIMIGAVSGSGKTYQMLQEGKQLLEQGIDAVLCAVTLPRLPEAEEWLASFERVPSIHWRQDGVLKKDLDVEALLRRNPEVVLVDGLAHRNRPGARNESRLQDIRELLEQGIGVITTVNVYELQGAQEMAPRFSGVRPEATVPAETLELADEVRLVDVSPETILKRLEEGNMTGGKAPALTAGTISVLRELALRLVAEGVGEELARHRERLGLSPSGAAERILVCAQYHWNGSLQVRRGEQIARRLGGDLNVLTFIQPGKPLTREQLVFKRSISKLAAKVGAAFEERPLKNKRLFPAAVIRYAAERGITRIVMGQSKEKAWRQVLAGNMAAGLLRRARGIDLFFMADRSERDGGRIIPARRRPNDNKQAFRRSSPEELAQKVGSMKRGRLKVYIGAAPGVGKTYAMLREGNKLLRKGVDVVIGLLETHGRRETIGQIGELSTVPRMELRYQETKLSENYCPQPGTGAGGRTGAYQCPGQRNRQAVRRCAAHLGQRHFRYRDHECAASGKLERCRRAAYRRKGQGNGARRDAGDRR